MKYNEAKKEILEALEALGESITSREIAKYLSRSHKNVSMALLRYHRQGLVSRYTIDVRTKVYTLTDRGSNRLKYLRSE